MTGPIHIQAPRPAARASAEVSSISEARRGRDLAQRLHASSPPALQWRDLGCGWSVSPVPDDEDGDVWICHDLRQRRFEACRLGHQARPIHCACCKRPLHRGEVAYREADPRDEPVSWRELRFCLGCATGAGRRPGCPKAAVGAQRG